MFQPLYVAATGLSALEEDILSITNNLANAQTVGFKKGSTEMESLFFVEKSFQDELYKAMSGLESQPGNVEFGTGVRVASTPHDFSQGQLETTTNALDFAIQGEGFFQYRQADGTTAYGRAGNLHLDNEGNLVDPNGHILEPGLSLPDGTTAIVVNTSGVVYAAVNNSTSYTEVGQINLARFTNPSGLKAVGQNIYQATEASGEAIVGLPGDDDFGTVKQYALEQSNVDVISEMMRMVMTQRVFDTVSKAVQSYEGMLTSLERMKA